MLATAPVSVTAFVMAMLGFPLKAPKDISPTYSGSSSLLPKKSIPISTSSLSALESASFNEEGLKSLKQKLVKFLPRLDGPLHSTYGIPVSAIFLMATAHSSLQNSGTKCLASSIYALTTICIRYYVS